MCFERTRDAALVRAVLTHPKIWPHVTDDDSPAAADFVPVVTEAVWYITASADGDWRLLALFPCEVRNTVWWEIHAAVLPEAWGEPATAALRGLCEWIWRETLCERITASIPRYNRLALAYARRAGMVEYGINPRSIRKHGALHDQVLVGISKPQQQQEEQVITCLAQSLAA